MTFITHYKFFVYSMCILCILKSVFNDYQTQNIANRDHYQGAKCLLDMKILMDYTILTRWFIKQQTKVLMISVSGQRFYLRDFICEINAFFQIQDSTLKDILFRQVLRWVYLMRTIYKHYKILYYLQNLQNLCWSLVSNALIDH